MKAPSIVMPAFTNLTVAITGASGYLASALVHSLRTEPCVLLRLTRPGRTLPPVAGAARVHHMTADIADPATWPPLVLRADVIFHLAAQTSVYRAEQDAADDARINVMPLLHLLEACRRTGRRPRVVLAGTVTQAGLTARLPVNEDAPDRPITVYDVHKLMSEQYLETYTRLGHVRGVTLRLPNIYGPGPRSSSADRSVVNAMIRKALTGETLTVYGSGEYLRDYLYIGDAVNAFLLAAARMEAVEGAHYVLGTGQGSTISETFHLIARRAAVRTGRAPAVTHVPPPPGLSPIEGRNFVADPARFAAATGWAPEVSLSEGIDRTMDFFAGTPP